MKKMLVRFNPTNMFRQITFSSNIWKKLTLIQNKLVKNTIKKIFGIPDKYVWRLGRDSIVGQK